jgi:hypothetical protein
MAVGGNGNEGFAQTHCRKSVLKKMSHLSRLLRSDAVCCVVLRCAVSWWRAWKYAVRRATCESINAMKNLSSCKRDASPDRPCPVKGKPSHVRHMFVRRCIWMGSQNKINACKAAVYFQGDR